MSQVRPLRPPPWDAIEPLIAASEREGFRFLRRLRDEHESGANRFSGQGEALLGVFGGGGELVAVGGLNRDPFSGIPRTGRLRHLYVLPAARRGGVGRALVMALIQHARPWFTQLVLRTDTAEAARFYETLGFGAESAVPGATHRLVLADRATDGGADTMQIFRGINVVSVSVPDLDAARRFYGEVLGLGAPLYDLPEAGWIEFSSGAAAGNLAVTAAGAGWEPSEGTTVVLDTADCHAACAELRRRGVRCDDPVVFPGYVTFCSFYDPFGNRLQMCGPAPEE